MAGWDAAVHANKIWLVSGATVILNFRRKSMPKIGPATAVCNKLQVNTLPSNFTVLVMKPQEGICFPFAPLRRGRDGLLLEELSRKSSEKMFFFNLYSISHPGRLASQHMISSRFVWRGLSSESTPGQDPNSTASSPRPTASPACCRSTLPSLNGGLLIFTLIWWDLYIIVVTAIIS